MEEGEREGGRQETTIPRFHFSVTPSFCQLSAHSPFRSLLCCPRAVNHAAERSWRGKLTERWGDRKMEEGEREGGRQETTIPRFHFSVTPFFCQLSAHSPFRSLLCCPRAVNRAAERSWRGELTERWGDRNMEEGEREGGKQETTIPRFHFSVTPSFCQLLAHFSFRSFLCCPLAVNHAAERSWRGKLTERWGDRKMEEGAMEGGKQETTIPRFHFSVTPFFCQLSAHSPFRSFLCCPLAVNHAAERSWRGKLTERWGDRNMEEGAMEGGKQETTIPRFHFSVTPSFCQLPAHFSFRFFLCCPSALTSASVVEGAKT